MGIITDKTQSNPETNPEGEKSLPCLYSNNSIENSSKPPSKLQENPLVKYSNRLSTAHKKSATILAWNVQFMAETHGLNYLGFLTLTFPFKVFCMKEAQRLFNSMATNFLRHHFTHWICVKERHKDGSIHFHLLVVCKSDIRTGFDFEGIEKRDYSSASPELKKTWSILRRNLNKYKFGRSELLPIKSTAEGIARYVGKYISKTVCNRLESDKGTRMVNYSGNSRNSTTRVTVLSEGSKKWRKNLPLFCKMIFELRQDIPPLDENNIAKHLGSRWAFEWREFILQLPEEPKGETP